MILWEVIFDIYLIFLTSARSFTKLDKISIIIDNTLLNNDGFSVTDLIHFKVWLYTFNFFPISLKFPFGSADVLAFYILCWYTPRTDNNKSTKQNILKWIKN